MANINKNKASEVTLWNGFLKNHPNIKIKVKPDSFYFCDNEKDANECAELVLKGIKRATATSLWWFNKTHTPLPKVGSHHIITDWAGNAKAIIEIKKVTLTPYNKITPEFVEIEGEGDKSLAYWKKVHKDYYIREMESFHESFNEDMMIVCEYFETIYKLE